MESDCTAKISEMTSHNGVAPSSSSALAPGKLEAPRVADDPGSLVLQEPGRGKTRGHAPTLLGGDDNDPGSVIILPPSVPSLVLLSAVWAVGATAFLGWMLFIFLLVLLPVGSPGVQHLLHFSLLIAPLMILIGPLSMLLASAPAALYKKQYIALDAAGLAIADRYHKASFQWREIDALREALWLWKLELHGRRRPVNLNLLGYSRTRRESLRRLILERSGLSLEPAVGRSDLLAGRYYCRPLEPGRMRSLPGPGHASRESHSKLDAPAVSGSPGSTVLQEHGQQQVQGRVAMLPDKEGSKPGDVIVFSPNVRSLALLSGGWTTGAAALLGSVALPLVINPLPVPIHTLAQAQAYFHLSDEMFRIETLCVVPLTLLVLSLIQAPLTLYRKQHLALDTEGLTLTTRNHTVSVRWEEIESLIWMGWTPGCHLWVRGGGRINLQLLGYSRNERERLRMLILERSGLEADRSRPRLLFGGCYLPPLESGEMRSLADPSEGETIIGGRMLEVTEGER